MDRNEYNGVMLGDCAENLPANNSPECDDNYQMIDLVLKNKNYLAWAKCWLLKTGTFNRRDHYVSYMYVSSTVK